MMAWIDRLFNEHNFVRRTGMLICFICILVILSFMLYVLLNSIPLQDTVERVLLAVLGLNTVYLGFYQWSRSRERP